VTHPDLSLTARPALVRDELVAVEALIELLTESRASLVPQVRRHLLQAGGKRLRPALTITCAKALGEPNERTTLLAACVEMVHTASLLHDDVVDDADRRRGVPSANRRWSNTAAVLCGDWLVATASDALARHGEHDALRVLSAAVVRMCEAELRQLEDTADPWSITEEECLGVIQGKTAALIAAACDLGALSVEAPPEQREAVHHYGRLLGTAFQIVDDVLDIIGDPQALGKPVGTDVTIGQPTLPLVCALRRAAGDLLRRVEDAVRSGLPDEAGLQLLHGLVLEAGGVEGAQAIAKEHVEGAVAALDVLPASSAKQALLALAEAVLTRSS